MVMNEVRSEMISLVKSLWDTLDPTGRNSKKFIDSTSSMSDVQFFNMIENLGEKNHLYFEIEAFENEPYWELIEAADKIVDAKIYDYIAIPHISGDSEEPCYTVNKVLNGYINMRRVQQMVNKKNNIPTDVDKINPKTGQVTGDSKAARVSDMEQFALICHGTENVLKEFFGPRAGDPVMKDEMLHDIATTGSASLEKLPNSRLNKVALNTANVALLGAALESNLVTEDGILPRTVRNSYKEAKGLSRK
jgi:hypothetical protein